VSDSPDKPKRRPRYSGRNPRHFAEKYKELSPDRYPDEVSKVIAAGKTPSGTHRPIMVREILEVLSPRPGDFAVDCTLGYGGHAEALLAAIQPGGRLMGLDVDPIELPKTELRLRALGFGPDVFTAVQSNFAGVAKVLPEPADILLADLGLSSMQIDNPERGFTYKYDGPLDLRMNPRKGHSASALLASLDPARLSEILAVNSDEPNADRLAPALLRAPATTTMQLAAAVRKAGGDEDSVRRVFQALRIAVNDEFGALDAFLRNIPFCLKPGGRVAILAFHSGEDRRVKKSFKAFESEGVYAEIARDVIRASPEERRSNPRSSSTKLRWARLDTKNRNSGI
jgi:16S rRNA (cytosine1402-N4)-methyltransferase